MQITWEDFQRVHIMTGTICEASVHTAARKPSYKLLVDMGPGLGLRKSSAQITELYTPGELLGKQVICVTNFGVKNIAGWDSEVLVTGFPDKEGRVVLAVTDQKVPDGQRLY